MPQPPAESILANFHPYSKPQRAFLIRAGCFLVFTLVTMLAALGVQAQESPIEDNSFLIEEAYNQEQGVVQHISVFSHFWKSEDWSYKFTQEWPFPGAARHQLSYDTEILQSGEFSGSGMGLGDLSLNYRYQLLGDGTARLAFAPRLSLSLPTGRAKLGHGLGTTAVQANLPLSVVGGERWVMHLNAGTTIAPRARNEFGDRASVTGYNLGHSFVWLAHSRFNVLLETVWEDTASVVGPDKTERSRALFLSPGIRWAHNFRSGLQIVPGLAMPVGVGSSAGERGLVIYLSFEHPYTR
ncbi:MAG: transporter [Acidobacteria bacterium]|nr:transporter [Acidobacteriota bacterium]